MAARKWVMSCQFVNAQQDVLTNRQGIKERESEYGNHNGVRARIAKPTGNQSCERFLITHTTGQFKNLNSIRDGGTLFQMLSFLSETKKLKEYVK
jgi:hypothetical protein